MKTLKKIETNLQIVAVSVYRQNGERLMEHSPALRGTQLVYVEETQLPGMEAKVYQVLVEGTLFDIACVSDVGRTRTLVCRPIMIRGTPRSVRDFFQQQNLKCHQYWSEYEEGVWYFHLNQLTRPDALREKLRREPTSKDAEELILEQVHAVWG